MENKKETLAARLFGFVEDERIEKAGHKVGFYCFGLLMLIDVVVSITGYILGNEIWQYCGIFMMLLGCLIFTALQVKVGVVPSALVKKHLWLTYALVMAVLLFIPQVYQSDYEIKSILFILFTSILQAMLSAYIFKILLKYITNKSDESINKQIKEVDDL